MKKIIYTRPDGGVSVVHPSEGFRLAFFITLADGSRLPSAKAPFEPRPVDTILRCWPVAGATVEWAESLAQFLERVKARSVPADASNVQIVDASAIPADRTFRNAWKAGAGGIECDMTKARDLTRDMLRAERAERFKKLDGEWMRAMGRGETVAAAAIEAKREDLRNWPQEPRLDTAAAPEVLKSVLRELTARAV